jgi:hypothetical protein
MSRKNVKEECQGRMSRKEGRMSRRKAGSALFRERK